MEEEVYRLHKTLDQKNKQLQSSASNAEKVMPLDSAFLISFYFPDFNFTTWESRASYDDHWTLVFYMVYAGSNLNEFRTAGGTVLWFWWILVVHIISSSFFKKFF